MLRRWNWIRPAQGLEESPSRRCLILSLYTSRARTLCRVSAKTFSQRCDPMKPPAPIMHIVIGFIGLPSRSILTGVAILNRRKTKKPNQR
uniref:UDP-D-apiose/UDP-D-xylose synthase 2-like n=1 Tax=Rhizophora mucronata TaxID=61149 RepID=A0A2P2PSE4_RHIMU